MVWKRPRDTGPAPVPVDNRHLLDTFVKVVNHSVSARTFKDTRGEVIRLGQCAYVPRPYAELLKSRGLVTILEGDNDQTQNETESSAGR